VESGGAINIVVKKIQGSDKESVKSQRSQKGDDAEAQKPDEAAQDAVAAEESTNQVAGNGGGVQSGGEKAAQLSGNEGQSGNEKARSGSENEKAQSGNEKPQSGSEKVLKYCTL
jgi:hypothetical protein